MGKAILQGHNPISSPRLPSEPVPLVRLQDEGVLNERLQISLVLDSTNTAAWTADVVARLRNKQFVDIASFCLSGRKSEEERKAFPLLFRIYSRWDERRNRAKRDPLEIIDLSGELKGKPEVSLDEIRADLVLWLSETCPPAFNREQVSIGTLRFVPADPSRYSGWPPYYWELFYQEPVSACVWEMVRPCQGADEPSCEIVASGVSATEIGWSSLQNRMAPFGKAAALLDRALAVLRNRFLEKASYEPWSAETAKYQPRTGGAPSNGQVASFLLRNARRTVQRRLAYRKREPYWFVAYRSNKNQFLSKTGHFDSGGFRPVEAPKGSFFADPFVISHAGRTFVFVEDYAYRERKGVISVLEMMPDGQLGPAQRVLERPYHLSYPFVFEQDGSVFMIPETMGSRQIELYRAAEFPFRWELVHNLQENIDAVDTTLWVDDGVFYFFTNVVESGTTANELLRLYCAESLYGEWHEHPANPICADVRASRGAGNLFRTGVKLIRPSQDCSVRYGYACQLNEVEVLTPTDYRERRILRIEPNWFPGLIGTHTINSNETLEVIDGQIYQSNHE